MFPGHGIVPDTIISDLSIGRRQMVEIARAFTVTDDPLRLVILDEPTSSSDPSTSKQLSPSCAASSAGGGATILISHLLHEILDYCDRIVVMRDGRVVADDGYGSVRPSKLIVDHGWRVRRPCGDASAISHEPRPTERRLRVRYRPRRQSSAASSCRPMRAKSSGSPVSPVMASRICLVEIFDAARSSSGRVIGARPASPWWRVTGKPTASSLSGRSPTISPSAPSAASTRRGLISRPEASHLAESWKARIGISTPDMNNNILSLSGGNQQKALFARALGSDAEIILMDDPMRGVDIGTKLDVYGLIAG